MSELTKRLRERGIEVSANRARLYEGAVDRIDKLEECLRDLLTLYDCNIAWGTATNKARALLEEK